MRVPFVDLNRISSQIGIELIESIRDIIYRSAFILGPEVKDFEVEFAQFCQARYCVGVASGTDALHLACRVLDIGPGDEVVIPANTFIGTALGVTLAGATPVLVDCNEEDFSLAVDSIEPAITAKTKAIIPVHLYGQCADMDPIMEIAAQHSLYVIEDSSQAHGAKYKGKAAGVLGDIACFSFYPGKNLGAFGDGGCLTTNRRDLRDRLLGLRNYGSTEKYIHRSLGFNSRLDTVQAAVLNAKLKSLKTCNESRQKTAGKYQNVLSHFEELVLPKVLENRTHVYHLFVCRHAKRDELIPFFKERGIDVLIHYPIPIHLQGAYASLGYHEGDFPVSERIAKEIFSLPIFPFMDDKEINYVGACMGEFLRMVSV